nr:hypothetical protein [Tanacetum cinerariifolium]
MNPTAASQIAFDNTLVPPEARLKIGNIETLPELFVDHMHQPWRTFAVVFNRCISEKTTRLDKLRTMNPTAASQIALDNTMVPPKARLKIGNIETLPELFVDHMHQPWRTFAVVFNRCISEKTTRLDKLRINLHTSRDDNLLVSPKEPTKQPGKAKKDVTSTKMTATKPKPTKKKAPIKANRGKGLSVLYLKLLSSRRVLGDSGEEDDDDNDGNDNGDDSDGNDDDVSDHERTKSDKDKNSNLNQSNEEPKEKEEEYVDKFIDKEDDTSNDKEDNEEELDDVEELYKDVNMKLKTKDVEITDADQGGADQHNVSQSQGLSRKKKMLIFNDRVTNLERDLSKMKQVDQEEALTDRREYIDLIDTSVRAVIKKEVNSQLPHIRPQAVLEFATFMIEQNITESLEVVVLAKSSSQPKFNYEVAASLSEFELTQIHIDKMKEHKSYLRANYKKELYNALVKSYNTEKDLFDTYEFDTVNNDEQPDKEAASKVDWFKKPEQPPTHDPDWNKR